MAELWKEIPIEGLENYRVSNYARIKSFCLYPKGRIIFPRPASNGYALIGLVNTIKNDEKNYSLHILVALAFVRNLDPENKTQVNHDDGDKLNCLPGNLEWMTPKENITHSIKTGLRSDGKGVNNVLAKLNEDSIRKIRKICSKEDLSDAEIGERFGVRGATIWNIRNRKTWKHVI